LKIECIHEARSALAEGALWNPREQVFYWIDQMRPEIHRFDPLTRKDSRIEIDLPRQLGGLALRRDGGLVLTASDGVSLIDPGLSHRTMLVNPIAEWPRATFNDAKCDRQGRLWAGTTDMLETEEYGKLYRIDADGSAHLFADGFICSNGPSFSPAGDRMYHTRSHDRVIDVFELDPATGKAGEPRILAEFSPELGYPDGTTVDEEGGIWVTHIGGSRITRLDPEGGVDRVIDMPARQPTSCAFGGPDMRTLLVTTGSVEFRDGEWVYMSEEGFAEQPTAGGLFAIELDVRGLPEATFNR
jgi:xylono-1,5-lactonase